MRELELEKENITESGASPKKKFWRRQFQPAATTAQITFDWILGVVLPVACFVFDPIIFKTDGPAGALFGTFKPFAYLLSFVSVMAMAAWLIWGPRLKRLSAVLAGLFFTGSLVSLVVGLVLLPFSLIGLIIFIGIFGFTPFFCAFIYLRNGLRALAAANLALDRIVLAYAVALSALTSAVVPAVVNIEIYHSLEKVRNGDAEDVRAEAFKLRLAAPLVDPGQVRRVYLLTSGGTTAGAEKKRAVDELYQALAGRDSEMKVHRTAD
ncbi:MAG: hypothetical protein JSS81_29650 [Acidobacteria bacterium]|nr:hypothetical protein [Acidobacteriota bacterium]